MIAEMLLPEFDNEMANTRAVLALVTDNLLDWKAGPEFKSIGWNANHLAEIPTWLPGTMNDVEWDANPVGGPKYQALKLGSVSEILAAFDANVAEARTALAAARDEDFDVMWSLKDGGKVLFQAPRIAVVRGFVINHTIHHRGHLLVYLRLNHVKVPGMYGPGPNDG